MGNNLIKGISGSSLKIIAMISMLIDHIAVVFYLPILKSAGFKSFGFITCITSENVCARIYIIGRIIGRIAFIIYAFLLIEGFSFTSSKMKYSLRLLIFSFISEIPFDLAFKNKIFDWRHQNVFFTLFIGLIAIWCMENVYKYVFVNGKWTSRQNILFKVELELVIDVLIGAVLAGIAKYIHTDYGMAGVITIMSMYYIRKISANNILPVIVGCVACTISSLLELFALISLPLFAFYNGKRGINSKFAKYFFYLFYPAHLLILYVIYQNFK